MPELEPTALPVGTPVGNWQVRGFRGRGTYGAVYRAVSVLPGASRPVALKLAIHPGDPRFEREAELLSRIRSPGVPRLVEAGQWRASEGRAYPFVVMEWVEGEPLYRWAARRNPCSRQVLEVLAQGARALQATHEVSGVHRDVKGDNMLVRPGDGRLYLTDFGAGYQAGATRLTPSHLQPGTPEYRSLQLWEHLQHGGTGTAELARPCDDVYALGVTAYRLVTDTYPPMALPGREHRVAEPRQLNPRVDAQLNALILRMLSARPEERGEAGELAEAMERGVAHGGPSAEERLFEWETEPRSRWTEEELADAEYLGQRLRRRDRVRVQAVEQEDRTAPAQGAQRGTGTGVQAAALARRERVRGWLPWLAAAMALGLWPGETDSVSIVERRTGGHGISAEARRKEEAVSVGDTALSSSEADAKAASGEAITVEVPNQPLPGQRKPNAKGRCPRKQVAINGGCWLKVDFDVDECRGTVYHLYQGGCYVPAYEPARKPTSAPGQSEP
jgi:hypothetical protein